LAAKRRQQGSNESRCEECDQPIVGVKVATEARGVLCVRCAQQLYGFEVPAGSLGKRGKSEPMSG
jgi:hypothetical protein